MAEGSQSLPPNPLRWVSAEEAARHHTAEFAGQRFYPARKLGFRRWGKHSAWLSAPHFAAPAADLRAEALTHFLVATSVLFGTPTEKGKESRKRKKTENET